MPDKRHQQELRFENDKTTLLRPEQRAQVLEALAALIRSAAVAAPTEKANEGR